MEKKLKYEQFGLTDIGKVRQANEDSFGFSETPFGPVFTVCDGMGGHVGGATASRIAVNCIVRCISESKGESPAIEINNAIVNANKEILDAVAIEPSLKGMGTTCTALYVWESDVHIGHVGDSRIYIWSDGKLKRLTRDHSFVQGLVDSGVINEAMAENHPRKNELTRALGVHAAVEPTINDAPIHPKVGDLFLMCTDGLCGLVPDQKMESILASSSELADAAQRLIDAAKDAGGFDNITVQLVRITDSPYTRSEFVAMNNAHTLTQTIVPEADEPTQESDPKATAASSKRMIMMLAGGVVVLLVLAYIIFWPPAGDGAEVVKNDSPVKDSNTVSNHQPVSPVDFPPCCYLESNSTVTHVIKQGESYSVILENHRVLAKDYNLEQPYAENGTDTLNKARLIAGEKLMWKPRPLPPKEIPKNQNLNPGPKPDNNTGKPGPEPDSPPKPKEPSPKDTGDKPGGKTPDSLNKRKPS